MRDARDGKMEILVYICPFPSQAIFHGVLRIQTTGEHASDCLGQSNAT